MANKNIISNNTISTGSNNTAIGASSLSGYTVTTGYSSIPTTNKVKFHIMGEDYEIETSYYLNRNEVATFLSSLNCLGWNYYKQCILNGYTIPSDELFKVIDSLYSAYLREQKINSILETKTNN